MGKSLRTPTRVVLLTATYFLGGLLGKVGAFQNGDLALVWPPAGIAIAAILLFGYRFLPGVVIGAFLFSTVDGKPLGFFTFGTAIGNCIGAMVCTYLLRQSVRFRNSLDRVRDAVALIVLACLFGTTINALFNVASLYVSGQADWENIGMGLLLWWVPNAMGCLVITPLLLSWSQPIKFQWSKWRCVEAVVCWGALVAGTVLSFDSWLGYGIQRYPLAYLPYPFLIWIALRFGVRGATLATFLVSTAAIHALLRRQGPFVMGSETESVLLIGSYIAVLAIANLLLAASATERRQSELRYRAVVEDQTERICRFDRKGNLTFVNDAYCRAREKSRDELLGTSFFPQLSADDLEIPLSRFLQLTPANSILRYDARMDIHGRPGWEACSIRAIFSGSGEIGEFQMVSQDISQRKEMEEALRASEEKIKAMLVDGIVTLDQEGRIHSLNPAAERIFGTKTGELNGRAFIDLVADADRKAYARYISAEAPSTSRNIELHGIRVNKTQFIMDLCASELALHGRTGQLLVVRDITDRKEVEEQLRHAQRMETVGHLAGGVAHDFNNILGLIIGHASLILAKHAVSEKVEASLQQLVKSAERGARLTRQLLVFSRREVMQPKLLDLNDTVRELTKIMQRMLGGSITLEVQCSSEKAMVNADEGMLDQVLMNLAVNARDAMNGEGTLSIRTGVKELDSTVLNRNPELRRGTYAFVQVADTGCGIPEDMLPRIFEPFFTTKEAGKGTGLGLSIVYGIVKQHQGWVNVSSRLGSGTTFEVFFPIAPASTAAANQDAALAA